MLKHYNVHLPLSTLMPKQKKRQKRTIKESNNGGKNTTIQYELLILDTMHDLLGTEPQHIYNILKNEIDLSKSSKSLKDSFLKSNYSFTRDAASYILQKANITIQNTYVDNQTRKAYDFALAASISNWTNLT